MNNPQKADNEFFLKQILMNQRGELLKVYQTSSEFEKDVQYDRLSDQGHISSVRLYKPSNLAYTGEYLCWIESNNDHRTEDESD